MIERKLKRIVVGALMTTMSLGASGISVCAMGPETLAISDKLREETRNSVFDEVTEDYKDIPSINKKVLKKALSLVGKGKYSMSHRMKKGCYDTSSFVARVLKTCGDDSLIEKGVALTSADQAKKLSKEDRFYTDSKELVPGDLIFFKRDYAKDRHKGIGHVTIYAGVYKDKEMIVDMTSMAYPVRFRELSDNTGSIVGYGKLVANTK